jgi:hypothetical protein
MEGSQVSPWSLCSSHPPWTLLCLFPRTLRTGTIHDLGHIQANIICLHINLAMLNPGGCIANVQVSQWPTCFYRIPLEAEAFALTAELALTIRKYFSAEHFATICYRQQITVLARMAIERADRSCSVIVASILIKSDTRFDS